LGLIRSSFLGFYQKIIAVCLLSDLIIAFLGFYQRIAVACLLSDLIRGCLGSYQRRVTACLGWNFKKESAYQGLVFKF
jgi:hypothetical protein